MRFVPIIALALLCVAGAAYATPTAQAAFAERRGLLEADTRCGLFTPDIRFALEAGAGQARGSLLRGGWTQARLEELEHAAVTAARARACDDARTTEAAARARLGFASWARTPSMDFPAAERVWVARRNSDVAGWRLRQDVGATGAVFGVREQDGQQHLSFVLPLAANGAAPSAAQIVVRDPGRARANLDVPGRTARGLEAGAPSSASAQRFWASARSIETANRTRQLVFTFPNTAFESLLRLDPRESIEVRLGAEGNGARYLIEVGDIAAARAFLAIRAR